MIHYYKSNREISKLQAVEDGTYTLKQYVPFNKKKTLVKETSYIDNRLHGKQRSFYNNGRTYFLCDYKNGFRDGLAELFSEKNIQVATWEYKDGLRNGKYTEWYDGRQIKCEIDFVNGEPLGIFKGYEKGRVYLPEFGGTPKIEKQHLVIEGTWEGEKTFYVPFNTGVVMKETGKIKDLRFRAVFDSLIKHYITEYHFENIFK